MPPSAQAGTTAPAASFAAPPPAEAVEQEAPETPMASSPVSEPIASPTFFSMSTPTPSKSRFSWLLSRIPEHKKTGNYQVDQANTDNRQALRDLISQLLEDDSMAPGLSAEAQRRRTAALTAVD